ncbi:chalcone isomerase family protein [Piscinibacter gummiphilus]|uniref:Chalcone isomerase family protein n=1 Tax=Piscinibacter gummiphilus TaxID=946333 RepID=A0ABZ0CUN4_9BURK|nr:chalcone isomerase family protein [Piscinibacter gummiphilus]WOB08680.1 chalcone isomerase family protein [Piscinibacter gummiphilus]
MRAALARPLAAFVTSLVLTLGAAQAQNTSTKFETTTVVAGTPLILNGSGTRHRAVFKVYDMALYTAKKVSKVDELLALPGPKRLNFVALRELPSTELGRLFLKGMGENSSKDLMTKHALASTRLIEVFSAKAKLMPGDSFAMEFVPGKGTQFFITGKAQGEPVGDAEFFSMILKIWVGPSPADNLLRDALLGG